jgi:cyclin H
VSRILEPLTALIHAQGAMPDVDAVREVDRRLKLCKNPEKVPGTRAFLARQAADEDAAAVKRARKATAAQQAMDAGDPFADAETETGPGSAPTAGAGLDDDDDD